MLIAGLDDAGRGPVIGPMVIAGVLIDESESSRLFNLGVRDSKLLSPETRGELQSQVRSAARNFMILEVSPAEIDEVVTKGRRLFRLNYLEAQVMARIIENLRPEVAYVDASDVKPERFAGQIRDCLPEYLRRLKIVSQHHADRKFPVVSAASILAKVRRDEVVDRLKVEFGDFGTGYSHDPKTVMFLKDWKERHGDYPQFVRRSWKTVRSIDRSFGQSTLND